MSSGTLKKLAGQTALYGISSILGRVLNYILVPLHTGIFQAQDYSLITKFYAFAAFLNIIYTLGMETTFFRFANKDPENKETYYSQTFWAIASVAGVFTLGILLFATQVSEALNFPNSELIVRTLALTLFIDAIMAIPFARLRLEGKVLKFVSFRVTNVSINVALNFLMLYLIPRYWPQYALLDQQVAYVFIINLLANSLFLIFLFPQLRQLKLALPSTKLAPIWAYSWPLLIMGLAGMTDEMLSRAFLDSWLPPNFYPHHNNQEALGIFGACYKLSIFMTLAIQAFRYAADPFFFSKAKDPNAPEVLAKVMVGFVLTCLLLFLGVSLNLWWLAPLFLKQAIYLEGLSVVPILLLANMFLGIYYNLSLWFKLTDNTKAGVWLAFFGVILTIIGNAILIPTLGYQGSAYATLICYIGMVLACFVWGQRAYPVPYPLLRIVFYILLATSLLWVQDYYLVTMRTPFRLASGAVLILMFTAFAFATERYWVTKNNIFQASNK